MARGHSHSGLSHFWLPGREVRSLILIGREGLRESLGLELGLSRHIGPLALRKPQLDQDLGDWPLMSGKIKNRLMGSAGLLIL